MQVGLGALALFVDHPAGSEPVKTIGLRRLMRGIGGQKMGKAETGCRRRLEAAVAPAAVQIEAVNRRMVDNGRAVRVISMIPPQLRSSRALPTAGTIAMKLSIVCSTIGRFPRAA